MIASFLLCIFCVVMVQNDEILSCSDVCVVLVNWTIAYVDRFLMHVLFRRTDIVESWSVSAILFLSSVQIFVSSIVSCFCSYGYDPMLPAHVMCCCGTYWWCLHSLAHVTVFTHMLLCCLLSMLQLTDILPLVLSNSIESATSH